MIKSNLKMKTLISNLNIGVWTYTTAILLPFLLIHFLFFIMPQNLLLEDLTSKIPDTRVLIILVIFFPTMGIALSIYLKRIKMNFPWDLKGIEKSLYGVIAFLSAYFLWKNYSILADLHYIGLFILLSLLFTFLPLWIMYLNSITTKDFNTFLLKSGTVPVAYSFNLSPIEKYQKIIQKIFLSVSFLILMYITTDIFGKKVVVPYFNYRIFSSRHPKITQIEPKIVYHSTKVILLGKNFGWNPTEKIRLINKNNVAVHTDLWTDTKIIFTIPLDWQSGEKTLWIEKPNQWEGKGVIMKSNSVTVKVIPANSSFSTEDDAFFKQLKYLNKETLEINGYR